VNTKKIIIFHKPSLFPISGRGLSYTDPQEDAKQAPNNPAFSDVIDQVGPGKLIPIKDQISYEFGWITNLNPPSGNFAYFKEELYD
jgi:hypothetical protein